MTHLDAQSSSNEAQTMKIAGYFTQTYFQPGIPILLSGQLGAGKTYFTKGIAQALGISSHEVISPSFALINEYHGPVYILNHMDFYRLENWQEVEQLGIEEYLTSHSFTVIEWGERFLAHFPPPYFVVKLTETNEKNRLIEIFYQDYEK
ncbi:tRNA (adenosine(37)-N6)-threonylcarbamoyltransferase complex ATPase subunit type 1 TsaE [Atribacter laminatus]|jgi:tRNA threonylcarbamoyladenosine biosynthesis protein TsaE|uniref:tRNA threonylcarbamoyladenosine biosynthesis protein TsaE n=1 Tax=Atribacter laminatus TaxID=2847778 RepID=A0A7T1ANK4_ATRLM|nr:tRNA (adenosine(37)-N6)-threonylcarbamoyltransferase complex ATPase subunit type 1 TsaE [Atribacter laminatus]QPM69214.1 tRNA threonylcarbamoyladenosine biosynthesis protein TsaE [Atribacter laminatus]